MHSDALVVISHYSARSDHLLKKLLSEISTQTKNIVISVNDDQAIKESDTQIEGFRALLRPNIGMNIGAWNAAFKKYNTYSYYIFLQDECSLLRPDFLEAYKRELSTNGVGMTGESINFKWDRSWQSIFESPLNYPVDSYLNGRQLSRVEYYLSLMNAWEISPGSTEKHLRALIWGFTSDALNRLNGFPLGNSKEECIASEIAVSKKIEQLGLSVTQISDTPFTFFKHEEWRADGTSKI